MAANQLVIEDDGYINAEIAGVTQKLDAYLVNANLVKIFNKHSEEEGDDLGLYADLSAYICGLGFPAISAKASIDFANAVINGVGTLQKKESSEESPTTS